MKDGIHSRAFGSVPVNGGNSKTVLRNTAIKQTKRPSYNPKACLGDAKHTVVNSFRTEAECNPVQKCDA